MTSHQRAKLQFYLQKTAGLELPLGMIEQAPTEVMPSPSPTNDTNDVSTGVVNTGISGAASTIQSAATPLTKPSLWTSAAKSLTPTAEGLGAAGVSALKGGATGLGYGALSQGLPIVEGAVENAAGYKPDDSLGSRMYSGVKDVSPLYLSQDPSQQAGSPKRTWGNFVDQSLTSGGGIKNFGNDVAAGSVWGLPGAVANAIPNAVSNIYSVGKGLAEWHNQDQANDNQLRDSNNNQARISDRQMYQTNHGIPMHNPSPEELASYHLDQPAPVVKKSSIQTILNKHFNVSQDRLNDKIALVYR